MVFQTVIFQTDNISNKKAAFVTFLFIYSDEISAHVFSHFAPAALTVGNIKSGLRVWRIGDFQPAGSSWKIAYEHKLALAQA